MLIKITEINSWEQERWTYVFELNKQEGAAINNLMIFIRCANKLHESIRKVEIKKPKPLYHAIFNPHPVTVFAASKYHFEFYDKIEGHRLINSNTALSLSQKHGYNPSTNILLDHKISVTKMKSAMIAMRDNNENKLYKNFDSVCLKKKQSINHSKQ